MDAQVRSNQDLLSLKERISKTWAEVKRLVRVERTDYDFNLETYPLPETGEDSDTHIQSVIERSRQNFGTPLADVEELLTPSTSTYRTKMNRLRSSNLIKGRQEIVSLLNPVESQLKLISEEPKKPIITPPPKAKGCSSHLHPKKTPKQKAQMGKGGQQHRYLQELIKRWGEHNGFTRNHRKANL